MDINTLLQSTDPFLRDLGTQAQQLKARHDAGKISDSAYAGECALLTDLEAQGAACNTEDGKQQLAEAVGYLAAFLGAI